MTHRFVKKLCMAATLALAATALLVPAAQADVTLIGNAQPKPVQASDVDAIKARWHNAGYDLRQDSRLPLGFARHKGGVSTVTQGAVRTAPAAPAQGSSSSVDWTPTVVVSALVAAFGLALLVGGTMARRRPVTP